MAIRARRVVEIPNFVMRRSIAIRPPRIKAGEIACEMPISLIQKRDELALSVALATDRPLFGLVYRGIQSDYFHQMPADSGVYLCVVLPTAKLTSSSSQPGDIDLLIVPYEGSELILHRTVAIEVKAVRASFLKQGKSPNEFGFTQARGLLALGFPYVAVAHLIAAEESPRHAWRGMKTMEIVGPNDELEERPDELVDSLPLDLIGRTFGRLQRASSTPEIGLISAFLRLPDDPVTRGRAGHSTWFPVCQRALPNPKPSVELLENVAKLFARRPSWFLDTPRFDPPVT